jgi:hypothetical protein
MAQRLKTVEYWSPMAAALADNTSVGLPTFTVYIPEAAASGVTFRSVYAEVVVSDANTTLTNITTRNLTLTFQGVSPSSVNNAQTLTQSGENFSHHFSGDFTAYFNANWGTSASRILGFGLLINTGTLGSVNATVRLVITYEFNDTDPVHLKTVWIPLNAATGALGITKSVVADTIPALDTYCPEAGKTFRQTTVVVQGNTESNSATDLTFSLEVDTNGAYTSGIIEKGSTIDVWYRLSSIQSFTTDATHSLYLWASVADFDHPQVWLVVTYEFTVSGTTTILNSLLVPMEVGGAMGGNTSSLYNRASRDLFIEEPATITTQRVAAFVFYTTAAAISGLNARVGTGSFVSYTSVATALSSGCGFMVRNDAAFTLARGRNALNVDLYNTDTADPGYNVSILWMINYTSAVPTNGIWAANHTILWNIIPTPNAAASSLVLSASTAPNIPEASYFLTAIGVEVVLTTSGSLTNGGLAIGAERLSSGEGGFNWESVYEALGGTDPEIGIFIAYATARSVFERWPGDAHGDRLPFETARRWRVVIGGNIGFPQLTLMFSYHSITFTASGDVSGSGGGTVTLHLLRDGSYEPVLESSRAGNGAFSFTWYDNTEELAVDAYEDDTHMGRSAPALATGSP